MRAPKPPRATARKWPWRRFFARSIDSCVLASLVSITVTSVGVSKAALDDKSWAAYVFWASLVPVAEFISLWQFGNSPGKALLGLKIVTDRGPLEPKQAFGRSFDVWLFGLGLNIPAVSLLTQYLSGREIKDKGRARWDEKWSTRVVAASEKNPR